MKQEIEINGPSVEEAISAGLKKLKLSRSEVDIEILDEGRRAILGIGGRDALVRLKALPAPEKVQPPQQVPEPAKITVPPAVHKEKAPVIKELPVVDVADSQGDSDSEVSLAETETAIAVLSEMLSKMRVKADISSHLTDPDDITGKRLPVVTINGDDLGVLIGPRGETLDALQYISRLMVGQKTQQRASFVIDIEGYRERREQALSRLAERMADKAVKRGSPVTLEAMPAYERRIIHIALRDSEAVRTESTGEGNRRRVRIFPT
jgi:spoIIIJ-associated protein